MTSSKKDSKDSTYDKTKTSSKRKKDSQTVKTQHTMTQRPFHMTTQKRHHKRRKTGKTIIRILKNFFKKIERLTEYQDLT